MAESHPYVSGPGNVVQAVNHLRNSFPGIVTADTLKKLGIAPNNESYVINTLRFINVIDGDGKKTTSAAKVFSQHQDESFQKAFGQLVKASYKDLFDVHGDAAWKLDKISLITFFRQSDDTSSTIGGRQAGVFQALAGLSGQGEVLEPRRYAPREKPSSVDQPKKKNIQKPGSKPAATVLSSPNTNNTILGLTVRVEINLPAGGDKMTYDNIFKSIKENLLDA